MLHFIYNCSSRGEPKITSATLATSELLTAEQHWLRRMQQLKFREEIVSLRKGAPLPHSSKLLSLRCEWVAECTTQSCGSINAILFHSQEITN